MHVKCQRLNKIQQQEEEKRSREALWPEKLQKLYYKAQDAFTNGKDNEAVFFISKIKKEKIENEDYLLSLKELILLNEYDGFEDDVEFCFRMLIKLSPDNISIWFSYIEFDEEYVGDTSNIINDALIQFPQNEKLVEMKIRTLIEDEEGIVALRELLKLKRINPTNPSISSLKESAIEIVFENEEEDNPEVMSLIEDI